MPYRDSANLPNIIRKSVAHEWNPSTQTGNWDRSSLPKEYIVIHTIVGSLQGAHSVFNNPAKKLSAHYGIGLNGEKWQWVPERFTAYANGNYIANQHGISIEHEDKWSGPPKPEPLRPDALYKASAELVADICKFYNIPCNRAFIRKHKEVSSKGTACPDNLDIDRIIREANAILNPTVSNPTPQPTNPTEDINRAVSVLQAAYGTLKTDNNGKREFFGNIEGMTRALVDNYVIYQRIKDAIPAGSKILVVPDLELATNSLPQQANSSIAKEAKSWLDKAKSILSWKII